jgi:hypothetical protein
VIWIDKITAVEQKTANPCGGLVVAQFEFLGELGGASLRTLRLRAVDLAGIKRL